MKIISPQLDWLKSFLYNDEWIFPKNPADAVGRMRIEFLSDDSVVKLRS